MPIAPLPGSALEQIFSQARTHSVWDDTPVTEDELRRLYELLKFAPTGGNSGPGRFVFVRSPEAKARLLPVMAAGNVDKTRAAPVTVVVAQDTKFFEHFAKLAPHAPAMKQAFESNPERSAKAALMGSTLQGAYLILAARSLGLDAGPMGGFDNARLDAEFFPDGRFKSNFLVNLGHGLADKLHPRAPRLSFEEACQIL